MSWIVYQHISPSNKVYVGITKQKPEYRWDNGKGYKRCVKFFNAILKYGWDNFEHKIIAHNLKKEEAILMEKTLIKYYKGLNLSYNITDGGEGGRLGYHISLSPESRLKISKAHIGLKHTEATKAKMSVSRRGRKQSKEWIAKRVKFHNVPIEAFIDGKWIKFESIKEASMILHIEQRNISSVCRGIRKFAGKIKFRYYDHNRI